MAQQVLLPNPNNAISASNDGYLVYNLETRILHRLNTTAALIFELSATGKSSEQICNDLATAIGGDLKSCQGWIVQAHEQGLLVDSAAEESSSPKREAKHFATRASDLRNEGEILAAFVCQEYATELKPDKADHWLALGELAHILGRRDSARDAYRRYLSLCPDNAEAAHILNALLDKQAPSRAPDECIQQLYSRFADFYEQNMCGELEYEAPALLGDLLNRHIAPGSDLAVLELGCGTGLAGKMLRPLAKKLIGIDLSEAMIDKSKALKLYDALQVAEITAFLAEDKTNYDLIAACDTFIYFGDLNQVITPAALHLLPGGHIAFTVEKGEHDSFALTDSGRYSHSEQHIRSVAKYAGLEVLALEEGVLRQEYGEPVSGLVVLLKKPMLV